MKPQSIRLALLTAIAPPSPRLAFAGGQPNIVRTVSKAEMQDRTGISRSVNQGKGAGTSRKQVAGNSASQNCTARERVRYCVQQVTVSRGRLFPVHARCLEIARLHNRNRRSIHMPLKGRIDLIRRERGQFRIHLRIPVERAPILLARRDQAK